jgi:hypothetical protein
MQFLLHINETPDAKAIVAALRATADKLDAETAPGDVLTEGMARSIKVGDQWKGAWIQNADVHDADPLRTFMAKSLRTFTEEVMRSLNVWMTDKDDRYIYERPRDDPAHPPAKIAEYMKATRTLIWREGSPVPDQCAVVKAHACLV